MRFKRVLRYDRRLRMIRLFRLLYEKGERGRKGWYSAKLSLAIWPKLLHWRTDLWEWEFTILGVRVHSLRSYGGIIV